MPATWFIVTGCVGEYLQGRKVATWQDWERASQNEMEIASHTVTHPRLGISPLRAGLKLCSSLFKKGLRVPLKPNKIATAKNAAIVCTNQRHGKNHIFILDEAIQSKNAIEAQILYPNVLSFAYPGGRYNSALKKGLRDAGYLSARSTDDGYNYLDSMDIYALKSKVWDKNVNATKANEWIDSAIKDGAWLIETYHIVSPYGNTDYHYDTAISCLENHLAYISSKNIWVDTQQNIAKYILERRSTDVEFDERSDERVVLIAKNKLDPGIYNHALTLKTQIPSTWFRIKIEQGLNYEYALHVEENGKYFVYYNIMPNKENVILTPIFEGGKDEIRGTS